MQGPQQVNDQATTDLSAGFNFVSAVITENVLWKELKRLQLC
jgi:hypothetical protein